MNFGALNNDNNFSSNRSGPPKPPPYVICYLCGRKYGTKSISIHEPSCIKKWKAENKKLPKHLRRKMPTKPDYSVLSSGDGNAVDQMNEMAFKAAQEQLIPCEFCGRTFYPERLPVHQRSCTADKPAATRPRTVTKGRTAPLAHTNQEINKKQPSNAKPETLTKHRISNQKVKETSKENSDGGPTMLCGLCQKQVSVSNIQAHLMQCNEEMTKRLVQSEAQHKDPPAQKVERPRTRTLHRGPSNSDKKDAEVDSKNNVNHATYDIDSPDEAAPQKHRKKSTNRKLSKTNSQEPPATTNYPTYDVDSNEQDGEDLVECPLCNRRFAADRIAKHQTVCKKIATNPKKVFDASKQRLAGTEAAQFYNKNKQKSQHAAPKSNWRQTHEDFIKSIRNAKKVTVHMAKGGKASDLPPPPPSLNPNYVYCQHCDRRFNPEVAERHIPRCATIVNRPKPPKQKALDAYKSSQPKKQQSKPNVSQYRNAPSRQNNRVGSSYGRSTPSSKTKNSFASTTGYVSPRYEGYTSPRDMNDNQNKPLSKRGVKTNQRNNNFSNDSYRPKTFSGVDYNKPPTRGYSYNAMNQTNPNIFGGYH